MSAGATGGDESLGSVLSSRMSVITFSYAMAKVLLGEAFDGRTQGSRYDRLGKSILYAAQWLRLTRGRHWDCSDLCRLVLEGGRVDPFVIGPLREKHALVAALAAAEARRIPLSVKARFLARDISEALGLRWHLLRGGILPEYSVAEKALWKSTPRGTEGRRD